jgi:hypothetical protein
LFIYIISPFVFLFLYTCGKERDVHVLLKLPGPQEDVVHGLIITPPPPPAAMPKKKQIEEVMTSPDLMIYTTHHRLPCPKKNLPKEIEDVMP